MTENKFTVMIDNVGRLCNEYLNTFAEYVPMSIMMFEDYETIANKIFKALQEHKKINKVDE